MLGVQQRLYCLPYRASGCGRSNSERMDMVRRRAGVVVLTRVGLLSEAMNKNTDIRDRLRGMRGIEEAGRRFLCRRILSQERQW